MYRTITDKFHQWKDCEDHKPLLITGVRQCGKTYSALDFANNNFDDVAYFDLERRKALRKIFDENNDTKSILKKLSINREIPITPGKTLLILDEVHACPKALLALQKFSREVPELHIIAIGALVDIVLKQEQITLPSDCVTRIEMYPMSFYEFLLADNPSFDNDLENALQTEFSLSDNSAASLENMLKTYFLVGGYPEAVLSWSKTSDLRQVDKKHDIILKVHVADYYKYASKSVQTKLALILDSLLDQLSNPHHKFKYSAIKPGAKEKDLGEVIDWLVHSGLIHKLNRVKEVKPPLGDNIDKKYFKLYLCDVGLLRRISGLSSTSILDESKEYQAYQEAFAKIFMLHELLCQGYQPFFWRSNNTAEIDFLIEANGHVIPMEAKHTISPKAKSLRNYCQNYQPPLSFRLSLQNTHIGKIEETQTITLPLYLSWRLQNYIDGK